MLAYWIGGVAVLCQTLGNLCLFRGLRNDKAYLLLGVLFLAAHFFCWCNAMRMASLSRMVPLAALGYPFSTLAAHLILKERIGRKRWLGVAMVSLGIWLSIRT